MWSLAVDRLEMGERELERRLRLDRAEQAARVQQVFAVEKEAWPPRAQRQRLVGRSERLDAAPHAGRGCARARRRCR